MDVLDLLAEQVEQAGVRTVDGNVVGDDSFFLDEPYGQAWGWDDLQWSYGAPVSALTSTRTRSQLNAHRRSLQRPARNRSRVDSERGLLHARQHHDARAEPAKPRIRAWIAAPDRCWCAPGARRRRRLHAGLAVEDPAEFTAAAFKQALLSRGVTVNGARHVARTNIPHGTGDFADERAAAAALLAPPSTRPLLRRLRTAACWPRTSPSPWPRTSRSPTRSARTCMPSCCCACWARSTAPTAASRRARAWCGSFWSTPA